MLTINAKVRKDKGKSSSRRLRRLNRLPAIVYGKLGNTIPIEIDYNIISSIQDKDYFYKEKILLNIDTIKVEVKIKEIQRHPFKQKIIHIDFTYV